MGGTGSTLNVMLEVERWVACGPRVVPHPQRLRWVENALDLHTVWLRPAAAGPEAPRSAQRDAQLSMLNGSCCESIEGRGSQARARIENRKSKIENRKS